jgi:FKBP-type peptidyl-prolyl cis-trans isomerase SlyD
LRSFDFLEQSAIFDKKSTMEVAKDMVVSLRYRLHVDDGESGKQFKEETTKEHPFVFLYGHQSLLPQFEENIKGLKVGDTFEFFIDYENAYGDFEEEKITYLPRTAFKGQDGKIDKNLMRAGRVIPMTDGKGNHLQATVLKVELARVKVDFNHPLAGYDLYFEGEILDVRKAEPEEIDHGHVHGPGGHHH